jgi:hypothetical protein
MVLNSHSGGLCVVQIILPSWILFKPLFGFFGFPRLSVSWTNLFLRNLRHLRISRAGDRKPNCRFQISDFKAHHGVQNPTQISKPITGFKNQHRFLEPTQISNPIADYKRRNQPAYGHVKIRLEAVHA